MSRLGTITRRALLVGSAAVAGGVVFGYYQLRKPHENPLLNGLSDGEAALTPWVLITPENVVLITPHTDLGQGAYSMQAMLIAEELDINPGQFSFSPGLPAPAYYNTALSDEIPPFMSHDDGFRAETMRSVMGTVLKTMGMMVTGGSSSVPDSYEKLRRAGAVARETLKAAAAQKTGVDVDNLTTRDGAVHLPDGTSLPYPELAALAATLEPVNNVELRAPSEWRLIGKETERLDIYAKSTGTLDYTIDIELDGMVHAAIRTNPRQGGALLAYDFSDAANMRGVQRILEVSNGLAVIADNTWRAFRAVEAINIEWGEAPYPADMAGHWQIVADSFTEERLDKEWRNDGNSGKALAAEDAIRVAAEYRAPYVAHQPMEPLCAIVRVHDDGAEVWAAHQIPRIVQQKVAEIVGCTPEQVRFYQQYAGGSFGHRLEFDFITYCAEIATELKGTPVKLTYTREEDFAHDYPRQIGMARGAGTVRDGQVESFDLQVATVSSSDSQTARIGRESLPGADTQIAAGAWNMPLAIPNFRYRAYKVPELAPTSSWRSVGASTQGFFANCFLDELIEAAGADPMQERLRLMNRDESRKVLEAVAEMCNWGTALETGKGRGVAFVDSFGVPVAEVVEVTDTGDGIRIDNVWVAADVGRILDPVNFESMMIGGVIWGLGHAMNCEITYEDGIAQQRNFFDHEGMRMSQCPQIHVRGLELASKIRGIGEPPVPPAAPALAGAIYAATGQRLREMPFNKFVGFI